MSVNILAIETSCDETSAAVVVDGKAIKSNIIYSQIATHRDYGGVVPEIASREHLKKLSPIVERALAEANLTVADLQAVAVTEGPGLVGSLLVGLSYAKAMALSLGIPLIGVHHLIGHVYGGIMSAESLEFPCVALITSGGHCTLLLVEGPLKFCLLGETRDDAAGEVLDKVARSLGLPYPGGSALEELAASGSKDAIEFPRAWLEKDSLDFSFSGLKSSVLNYLNRCEMKGMEIPRADVASSFQEAVFDVLAAKSVRAAVKYKVSDVILCGGVAANGRLRACLLRACEREGIALRVPPKILCTDNGAMIGGAAYEKYKAGKYSDLSLNAAAVLPIYG